MNIDPKPHGQVPVPPAKPGRERPLESQAVWLWPGHLPSLALISLEQNKHLGLWVSLQLWHSTALSKIMSRASRPLLGFSNLFQRAFFFIKKYPQAEHSARAIIKAIIILVKTSHSQYRCNLQQRSHINTEQYFLFVHQTLCFRPVGVFVFFFFLLHWYIYTIPTLQDASRETGV